jgi:hypothetical protein
MQVEEDPRQVELQLDWTPVWDEKQHEVNNPRVMSVLPMT